MLKTEGTAEGAPEVYDSGLYVSGWVKRGPSGIIGESHLVSFALHILMDLKEVFEAKMLSLGFLPSFKPDL